MPLTQIATAIVVSLVCLFMAYQKGYSLWAWFLGGSFVGLIFLAFLPDAADPYLRREARDKLRRKGNWIGIGLSLISVSILVLIILSHLKPHPAPAEDTAAKLSQFSVVSFPES